LPEVPRDTGIGHKMQNENATNTRYIFCIFQQLHVVLLQISILIYTVTIYIVHVDVEVLSMLLHFNKFHIVKLIIVEF
jgi:hypothetical protein